MILELLRRSLIGLGFAAIITFIALTIMMVYDVETTVSIIWKNMSASLLMGIYFSVASLIFEIDNWSPLKQTVVHFLLSVGIWLPIAFIAGWVPIGVLEILIAVGIFVIVYTIFWLCARAYFLRVEKEMNRVVSHKTE
ncbi:DUF3021 domain-containing protein [Piscibacillus halophilus]|uniref:DUF3021 domain-containing protein n=1 Tax=Piscibacillus halophilus TaxID=571933 RepID=A0A1H9ME61_9BACI|nr:DUF3021 domain-containing protein [Piscibacillus halophilus]SER21861.1 Protein of unknown function [Piscibacillus halophilus]